MLKLLEHMDETATIPLFHHPIREYVMVNGFQDSKKLDFRIYDSWTVI
ncbi:MAG TPA: hypothetical protein VIY08_12700 [Candidatus Nitrosocosmicus sp.]